MKILVKVLNLICEMKNRLEKWWQSKLIPIFRVKGVKITKTGRTISLPFCVAM